MERLTTDKPVSEMGMFELAHNSCYIGKDGSARYRDFESDIDAREFARVLCKDLEYLELSADDDEFDDEIMDVLMHGPEYILGLIALFYRNLWAMAGLREQLKEYEDLEEQGLLLKLPCKVGDKAYHIIKDNIAIPPIYISEHEITDVSAKAVRFADDWWTFEEMYENNAFLNKAEAEKALAEMEK